MDAQEAEGSPPNIGTSPCLLSHTRNRLTGDDWLMVDDWRWFSSPSPEGPTLLGCLDSAHIF